MLHKLGTSASTRGIRNNNPFNIRKSENSWKGKIRISGDKDFEQFTTIWFGLRAGFLLLRNAYLNKGFDTPLRILYKYAPCKENDTQSYLDFVCSGDNGLTPDTRLSVNSLSFFEFLKKMLWYESKYDLTYENYNYVVSHFKLW